MGGRVTAQQRGDLLARVRLPQAVQQLGDGVWAVEGDVGGRVTAQQRGDLLARARLPQAVQQLGDGVWAVEGAWAAGLRRSSAAICSRAPVRCSLCSISATASGLSRETCATAQSAGRASPRR